MALTERTPLLAEYQRSEQDGQSRDNDNSAPRARVPLQPSASPLPKLQQVWQALRAGRLPDNRQLYAILTSSAAFFHTISDATAPPPTQGNEEATLGGPVLKTASAGTSTSQQDEINDPLLLLSATLAESSALMTVLAKWLIGRTDDDGSSQSKDTSAQRHASNGSKSGEIPRGNDREQLQRLYWHTCKALSSGPQGGIVNIEAQGGLQGRAQEALNAVKDAAAEAQQDASSGVMVLARIVAAVLSSDELMRIPSDIIRSISVQAADALDEASKRAANVEHTLRTESGANRSGDDFAYPQEALQQGFNAVADAADVAFKSVNGKDSEIKPQEQQEQQDTFEDKLAYRLARLMDELGQDETLLNAVDNLVALFEKYLQLIDRAKDDVTADIGHDPGCSKTESSNEPDASVQASLSSTEKHPAGVKATMSSDAAEGEISAHFSRHAVKAFQAACQVIEGIAGGHSLDPLVEKVNTLKALALENSSTRQWVEDAMDFVQTSLKEAQALAKGQEMDGSRSREDKTNEIKALMTRLQQVMKEQPRISQEWQELKSEVVCIEKAIRANHSMVLVKSHARRIKDMTRDLVRLGTREARQQTSHALSRLFNAILPSIGEVLGYVPLPRVEFASENLDASVEDVNIAALQLIPETIRFSATNDWQFDRRQDRDGLPAWHTNTGARLSFGGLRLALENISFYIQERYTAPSENACCACCSFGQSSSRWCLLRGPSSWLAYTERALMDIGFGNEGVGIDIDVKDAGLSARQWKQERDKRRRLRRQQRDNRAAGNIDVDLARQKYSSSANVGSEESASDSDDSEDVGIGRGKHRRTTFFEIKSCKVNVGDSFDFRLRNSRHWLINGLLRYSTRPIIRTIIRRVLTAQVSHAFTQADTFAWDVHSRAKNLCMKREGQSSKTSSWQKEAKPESDFPALSDYFKVLLDSSAGKSKRRLAREKRERELAERQRREQAERDAANEEVHQPKAKRSMEIKASGIAMHDEEGEYSIAIGFSAAPGTVLKDEYLKQRGPDTRRTRVREAATHPRETLATAQEYGAALHKTAVDAANETGKQLKESAGAISQSSSSKAKEVSINDEFSQSDDRNDSSDTLKEATSDDSDDGWRSTAFDIAGP